MKIGVIGAMQMEIDNLKASLENQTVETISGVEFVSGTLDGKEVVAAMSGIGKVFAAICTEAMIIRYNVDMIINVGVAGTLCKELGVMDVAVATQVVQHDMNTSALGDPVGLLSGLNQIFLPADDNMRKVLCEVLAEKGVHYVEGTIATGDLFLHKDTQKALLYERFGAIAGEMEGGSVGHVCHVNNVPFAILRSISDGEGGAMDYATFAEKAADVGIQVVVDFIKRV